MSLVSILDTVAAAVGPDGSLMNLPATLHMQTPMPGLDGYRDFTLTSLDEHGVLFAMRAEPDGLAPLRLFLAAPSAFFPEYEPRIDDDVFAQIGLDADDAAVALVVVHPAVDNFPPTANLLAPVVMHPGSGEAVQAVLDERWPLHAPIG